MGRMMNIEHSANTNSKLNAQNSQLSTLGPVLAMAGVNVIWGAAFPLTKPALATIPPFTFALLRFSVALIVLLPLARGQALALLRGPDGRRLAVMGLLGFCVAQLAQTLALSLSPASDIALLSTASPLWIALLAWLWLGERVGRRRTVGFGLALGGLVLILWPHGDTSGDAGQRALGDVIFLVNGFTWACYNVMGKAMMARHQPLPVITAAGMVGFVGLLPFAAGEWLSGKTPQVTPVGAAAVAYTGLLVTVVGFLTLFWAYSRVRAAQVAITMYLQPLAGVLVAWALLHEPLGAAFLVGAALVFAGVWVVTTTGRLHRGAIDR
jgi:drug/metabolite transporter (DMT)-like permease